MLLEKLVGCVLQKRKVCAGCVKVCSGSVKEGIFTGFSLSYSVIVPWQRVRSWLISRLQTQCIKYYGCIRRLFTLNFMYVFLPSSTACLPNTFDLKLNSNNQAYSSKGLCKISLPDLIEMTLFDHPTVNPPSCSTGLQWSLLSDSKEEYDSITHFVHISLSYDHDCVAIKTVECNYSYIKQRSIINNVHMREMRNKYYSHTWVDSTLYWKFKLKVVAYTAQWFYVWMGWCSTPYICDEMTVFTMQIVK